MPSPSPRKRSGLWRLVSAPFIGPILFMALVVAVAAVFTQHFDALVSSAVLGAAVSAWTFGKQRVPKALGKTLANWWNDFLATPRARTVFGAALGVVILAEGLTSSLHIHSPRQLKESVTLYQLATDGASPGRVAIVGAKKLDGLNHHQHFLMLSALGGQVSVASSKYERTPPRGKPPASRHTWVYPEDFTSPIYGVALLPMEGLLRYARSDAGLRMVVVDRGGAGTTIADTTISNVQVLPGLILGVVPATLDTAVRSRWVRGLTQFTTDTTSRRAGPSPADVASMVDVWMKYGWFAPVRDLNYLERLRIVVMSGTDTLASQHVTLSSPITDVILAPRS